jgi:ankyrin repeat protein
VDNGLKTCLKRHGYEPSAELLRYKRLSHDDLNQPLEFGDLPIELAFAGGARAVRALVACGADPNAITNRGFSVLASAVHRYAGPDVVQALLDGGADPNGVQQEPRRYPPLEAACDRDWRAIPTLVRGGADPNGVAPMRPLYKAISSRHGLKPMILLIRDGANPDLPCLCDYRPIELAALENQCEMVDLLLGLGVNIRRLRADINLAASAGLEDAIARRLRRGVAVDTPDHQGRTPIVNALASCRARTARLLLEAGADVYQHVRWLRKAPPAVAFSVIEATNFYFGWDGEPDVRDDWTLLELAASHGDLGSLAFLLLRDPTPRARNLALLKACQNWESNCAQLLLQFGADPNFQDEEKGSSPISGIEVGTHGRHC